ncbi:MAG: hypothetical protein IJN88_02480 [Clostridia bacterium]|nr:hypothetical protein [Clostridia bacterium]
MNKGTFEWIPLDNAGKVFPGQNTKRWSNVFRLTVQLKEDVDPELLKKALSSTLERIPTFRVRIRSGFFWNYYEKNSLECPVNHDIKNHCYRIGFKENNGYLFRVYYYRSRISLDIYHALCDGYGGAVFLSTLTGEYLRLRGESISFNRFVLSTEDEPAPQEREDAYIRYAAEDTESDLFETPAHHIWGTKLPLYMCNYTTVTMSFAQLHAVSRGYGVTVTELLAAVLLDIHYSRQAGPRLLRKDVSVQIPLNLRKVFPHETLRNFVMCLSVKINPRKGEYTFEEILESVKAQLRHANNKKALNAYITRTVKIGTEKIRFLPLIVKNTVIKVGFAFGAEYSTTALISNLGPITVPGDMEKHIEKFLFYTGPGIVNGARCGVISFGDRLTFTFSNRYKENDIERDFMKRLTAMGISLTVETNREEVYSDIDGVSDGDREAYPERVHIPSKSDRVKLPRTQAPLTERMKRTFHL